MKRLVVSLLWVAGSVHAAPPRGDYVTVEKVAPVEVAAGGFGTALVKFAVKEGYHVQANPAANPQLVATVLNLPAPKAGLTAGPVDYPAGQPYRLKGSDTAISTYSGSVALQVSVAAAAGAKPGARVLATTLRYQACDNTTCFFPQTDAVVIPVRVLPLTKTPTAVQRKR